MQNNIKFHVFSDFSPYQSIVIILILPSATGEPPVVEACFLFLPTSIQIARRRGKTGLPSCQATSLSVQTGLHHKFGPTWSWGRIAAQYVCLPRFWFWSPPQLLLEKPPRCLLRLFISSKGAGCPGAPEWTRDIGWEFWDLKGWPQISAISRCSLRSSTCWWPEVNFCCCIELLRMLLIGSAFQLLPNRGVGFWTLLLHHRFASRCRHHVSC